MTEQDMTNAVLDLKDLIDTQLSESILGSDIEFGELNVRVAKEQLLDVVEQLKRGKVFEFATLVDITAIDRPENTDRFQLVYQFLSMTQNHRIRLLVDVEEDESVPSLCAVHASANWYEREVFDMFGIVFTNHPDLRRILTDYGFQGHPLRKDFPTTGYVEVRYDEKAKKVIYEPVTLVQEYRQFDFLSPWDGAKYILPGDEKSDA